MLLIFERSSHLCMSNQIKTTSTNIDQFKINRLPELFAFLLEEEDKYQTSFCILLLNYNGCILIVFLQNNWRYSVTLDLCFQTFSSIVFGLLRGNSLRDQSVRKLIRRWKTKFLLFLFMVSKGVN